MNRTSRHQHNQSGMVSIMVTMIMMIVISLVVLGFAQVSRRESRQSLDRQLSTQAFYAAESGINDARTVINAKLATGAAIPEKANCPTTPADADYPFDSKLDAANNVSYTCLLVTSQIKNIHISPLTAGANSTTVPIEPATAPIQNLTINWRPLSTPTTAQADQCAATTPPATGAFPQAGSGTWNCPYGVLRLDIVPTDTLSRAAMQAGQKTMFLYPTSGAAVPAAVNYATSDGTIVMMHCKPITDGCTTTLTNMTSSGSTKYAVRVSAIYNSGSLDITADSGAGSPQSFKNAQVQVDVTGKAQDVLRRVQVRLPMVSAGKVPDYALETAGSVCKRFRVSDRYFEIPNDIIGQDVRNPTCGNLIVQKPCSSTPHDISLILDSSISMQQQWQTTNRITKLTQVVNQFLTVGNIGTVNHANITSFNMPATLITPLTGDLPTLQTAMNTYFVGTTTVAGTQHSEGLKVGSADILASAASRPVAKTIILISDGQPSPLTDGPISIAYAAGLKAQNVEIYTIAIASLSADTTVLQAIATDPAHFLDATDEPSLDAAFQQIAAANGCI